MKIFFKLALMLFLISGKSCFGQKMVQSTEDAKKLEVYKEKFIGEPLSVLLKEVQPKIKLVYGNPENSWGGAIGGTYLKFHFADRDEIGKKLKKKQKPTGIIVNFKLNPKNAHKPLPKGGVKEWTEQETKEYGDMIIANIRVVEET